MEKTLIVLRFLLAVPEMTRDSQRGLNILYLIFLKQNAVNPTIFMYEICINLKATTYYILRLNSGTLKICSLNSACRDSLIYSPAYYANYLGKANYSIEFVFKPSVHL